MNFVRPMNAACPGRKCWRPSGSRSTLEGVRPKACLEDDGPESPSYLAGIDWAAGDAASPASEPPGRTPARLTEPLLASLPTTTLSLRNALTTTIKP